MNRLAFDELFDVSNIDAKGEVIAPASHDWIMRNVRSRRCRTDPGQYHFPRRLVFQPAPCGVRESCAPATLSQSLLLVHSLPPPGTGGGLEFADSRTAYDDLSPERKAEIADLVMLHSQHHSRRIASPDAKILDEPRFQPTSHPFGRHKIAQEHEASGRMNLYIANHGYLMEGMSREESAPVIQALLDHASQPKYTQEVEWENPTDLGE
jgi:alpha-ketoglutarate-dependent 2,4-dichlorophenoxyacetate dioxygenase